MDKKPTLEQFAEIAERDRRIAMLSSELKRERARSSMLERGTEALQQRLGVLEKCTENVVAAAPAWLLGPKEKGSTHHGMPTALFSDWHLDEVVRPEEIEGRNKFNRKIALQRMHRLHDKVHLILNDYVKGLTYDGLCIMLGGDMLSGSIHEELIETNEETVYGSLDFWSEQLAGLLNAFATDFPRVHVAGVVGNHGRRTRKPVAKRRVRDNLDWLMYRMVARQTPNITWTIPESADVTVRVYDTSYLLTHGDQFRGGSGISGIMAPILLGQHRKVQQRNAIGEQPFDYMALGHWHQWTPPGRGVIINGALKGFDEHAYVSNYRYEPPIQGFWITTPENGIALTAPIFCGNRKAEGW